MIIKALPRIWEGNSAFIIGGGPSIEGMDLSPIHDKRVIGVNNAYQLGPWVDVCYFGDYRWYYDKNWKGWHRDKLLHFAGMKITRWTKLEKEPGILVLKKGKNLGIDLRPDHIAWNRSSGGSAINLAVHFGVKKIILLGFDMKMKEGKHNYHDDHDQSKKPPDTVYKRYLNPFSIIKKELDELNIECLNATPDSAIEVFKKVKLEDIV